MIRTGGIQMRLDKVDLYEIAQQMIYRMGPDEFLEEMMRAQRSNEFELNLRHIDRNNDLDLFNEREELGEEDE